MTKLTDACHNYANAAKKLTAGSLSFATDEAVMCKTRNEHRHSTTKRNCKCEMIVNIIETVGNTRRLLYYCQLPDKKKNPVLFRGGMWNFFFAVFKNLCLLILRFFADPWLRNAEADEDSRIVHIKPVFVCAEL